MQRSVLLPSLLLLLVLGGGSAVGADDDGSGELSSFLKVGQTLRIRTDPHGGMYDIDILAGKQLDSTPKDNRNIVVKIGRDHIIVKNTIESATQVYRTEKAIAFHAIRSIILRADIEIVGKP